MQIGLTHLGGNTPVFFVKTISGAWSRVYGATLSKAEKRWYFPAFHPFIERVLADFKTVAPDAIYAVNTQAWVTETMKGAPLPNISGNFEHQNEGLQLLKKNYRYILNWEMGTGKSLVIIELVQALKEPTLILCPVVAATNWQKEITKHVGNALSCLPLVSGRQDKLEGLKEAKDFNVVTVSFNTARLYGLPMLHLAARKALVEARFPIPKADLDLVRQVNDPKTQIKLIQETLAGKSRKELKEEVTVLTQEPQWLTQVPYKIIVADESHRIKHLKSLQTKVCMRLAAQATRRYLLSGTLSQGDPRDMYSQLKFLAPYLIKEDYRGFQQKYVSFSPWNKHIVTGFKNLHILNAIVTSVSSVKKLKECKDMPTQTFVPMYFDLYPEQVSDYNYAVKENGLPTEDFPFANGAVRISKLLEICSGFHYSPPPSTVCDTCASKVYCVEANIRPGAPHCARADELPRRTMRYGVNAKLDALNDLLDDLLEDPEHKVVIWTYFDVEIDDVQELLKKRKVKHVRVDASNSSKAVEIAEEFSLKDYRVYLGKIGTGISIDLTASKYMVYYGRSWKLDDWDQSSKRSHRITQNERTLVYNLIARHTVEENQMAALELRQDISKLLTEKANCLTCARYEACQKTGIKAWDAGCKMETSVPRGVTKPKEIKGEK
jgi:SNF2 family DNA or RNA helicase